VGPSAPYKLPSSRPRPGVAGDYPLDRRRPPIKVQLLVGRGENYLRRHPIARLYRLLLVCRTNPTHKASPLCTATTTGRTGRTCDRTDDQPQSDRGAAHNHGLGRDYLVKGVSGDFLVGFGGRESVGEGDRERVEGWFPSHGPSCPPDTGGVQRPGHQVEAFQRGQLAGEVAAGFDRAPVPGVERLDRVGGAQDAADLDWPAVVIAPACTTVSTGCAISPEGETTALTCVADHEVDPV
jgi:hypothetical protein